MTCQACRPAAIVAVVVVLSGTLVAQDRRPAPGSAAAPSDPRVAGVEWAYIPPGRFEMGCTPGDRECDADESPRHTVTLSRPFELMTTEVTLAMARASGRTVPAQPAWTRDDHPVIINWDEASAICRALAGRLPTEAEWEYAARGGQPSSRYPWGPEAPVCAAGRANGARFDDDAGCDAEGASTRGSVAVASYASNGHGLYDMAGNVWEWVADWYAAYANGAQTDPRGPTSGAGRVLRGGSWFFFPRVLRVSNLSSSFDPSFRLYFVGVRCARDVSP